MSAQPTAHESDNRFLVFGLFFLNRNGQVSSQSSEGSTAGPSTSSFGATSASAAGNASNRLVFFMFNCAPDNVKHSIVNHQSNTYLIRKSLFSIQRISQKQASTLSSTPTKPSATLKPPGGDAGASSKIYFSEQFRFYSSRDCMLKRANTSSGGGTSGSSMQGAAAGNAATSGGGSSTGAAASITPSGGNSTQVSATTPTNIMKKCISISDILRHQMMHSTGGSYYGGGTSGVSGSASQSGLNLDVNLLSSLDFVEESCAKSYIKSVIHYMGLFATQQRRRLRMPESRAAKRSPRAIEPNILGYTLYYIEGKTN